MEYQKLSLMDKKKTVCEIINHIKGCLKKKVESGSFLTMEDNDVFSELLETIRVRTQHMENRLFQYRNSIEKLGFRRKRINKNV